MNILQEINLRLKDIKDNQMKKETQPQMIDNSSNLINKSVLNNLNRTAYNFDKS